MSDYFFTHNIYPNCHRRIGQCDLNISQGEALLNHPRINKEETKVLKLLIKIYKSEKAFVICACNRDKVGCQKWFDKTNERTLLAMEQLENLVSRGLDEGTYLQFSDMTAKKFHENATWVMEHL